MTRISLYLLLMIPIWGAASHAESRDDKVAETLSQEGFSLEQSSVAELLQMIRQGKSWGSDRLLPYYNLERFAPYSYKTGSQVLDLVFDSIAKRNREINVDRLLQTFQTMPVQYPRLIKRLSLLLENVKSSETRLLLAQLLLRYPQTCDRALEILHASAKALEPGSAMQIQILYILMSHHAHQAESETLLARYLQNQQTALLVLALAPLERVGWISNAFLEAMEKSISLFPPPQQPSFQFRLDLLKVRRFESIAGCQMHLVGNGYKL